MLVKGATDAGRAGGFAARVPPAFRTKDYHRFRGVNSGTYIQEESNPINEKSDWFRIWLGAGKQQAITWANIDPDLCCYMVSLGLNELIN